MKKNLLLLASTAFLLTYPGLAQVVAADVPGAHPDYVQAINDLKFAKALLGRPDSPAAQQDEVNAIMELDASIHDLIGAAAMDGKNLNAPTIPDAGDRGNRVAKALELMGKAQLTVDAKEDDVAVLKSRASASKHLSVAIGFARKLIGDDAAKK